MDFLVGVFLGFFFGLFVIASFLDHRTMAITGGFITVMIILMSGVLI